MNSLSTVEAWDAKATRIETPCGDGTMVWRAWGQGRPLVLFHGGAGSWRHWIRTLPALSEHYRLLVPDMPGLGESAVPDERWSPELSAQIAAEGLRRILGPEETFTLVGFSAGALVGGVLTTRLSERCDLLVIVGAGSLGTARGSTPLAKVRGKTGEEAREGHRHNLATLMIADPAKIDEEALAIQAWNSDHARVSSAGLSERAVLRDALAATTVPVKAIWGAKDQVARTTLDERQAILRDLRPGMEIALIPEAGHWVAYEAAEAFNATLLGMLGATADTGR